MNEQPGSTRTAPVHMGRLVRLGRASAAHPLPVIGAWVLILLAVVVGNRAIGGTFSDNVDLPGTQAQTGSNLLTAHEPSAAGYTGKIVFHVSSGTLTQQQGAIGTAVADLGRLPHVLSASNPFSNSAAMSADGRTAYSNVQFDVRPKTLGASYLTQLNTAVAGVKATGTQVEFGGSLDELTRPKAADLRSEAIGFAVALVVLIIGFGSLLGAALPLLTALFSTVIGISLLGITAGVIAFGTASPTLAAMIGLGVGIDYALFLTTRFRQRGLDGWDPVVAAGDAVGSSGHAVLVAAGTVSVALLGLYASGITFIGQLGLAAVFGVVVSASAAVTLVPAGLGLVGRRIDRFHLGKLVAEQGTPDDFWHRYAATVTRRPWTFFAVGLVILAVLAIPVLRIQLGHVDDGADPVSFTDKRAYDLIATGFGAGANGTMTVVVDLKAAKVSPNQIGTTLQQDLAATPDVARVSTFTASPDGRILFGTVLPKTTPQDQQTRNLFDTMVSTALPRALTGTGTSGYVTGSTASLIQFQERITSKLILIVSVVVLTAFLLILMSFRSLLLATKAALLNLMSIAAAYGVLVAVFPWGWGRRLIGVSENVPIESYVPMIMFAIVFGLSMDYEIFLLSRVKEAYDHTRENTSSVAAGLASTGRVITSAALIMISVFVAFAGSTVVVVKMLAVGLAVSVLIDALVVRLLLVPATMTVFASATWWMPKWLDRVLPHLEVEGRSDA